MPLTEDNVRTLFQLPIFVGNAGSAKRLKPGRQIHQDGAYWVPLILAYTGMSRKEACGLELRDVFLDEEVPFFAVVRNMTKSIDSKTSAGLKNRARQRLVPIHPELLRLGLREYVEARKKEKRHDALFPELYFDEKGERFAKRGGTRFYARAGDHMLDAVDAISPLPRTPDGKRADIHSMRTYAYSMFSVTSGLQPWIVCDIFGHARDGMGQQKYNRAEQAVGRDA